MSRRAYPSIRSLRNPHSCGYETVSDGHLSQHLDWKDEADSIVKETLQDQITVGLCQRSNLTRAQFETILVDQLGSEMANKRLTREEMARLRQTRAKVTRGAFNRTLKQSRTNVSEAVHTVLLLGYSGLLESPSLAPFLEASERLRTQTVELKRLSGDNSSEYSRVVAQLLDDLERAFEALFGKERDT